MALIVCNYWDTNKQVVPLAHLSALPAGKHRQAGCSHASTASLSVGTLAKIAPPCAKSVLLLGFLSNLSLSLSAGAASPLFKAFQTEHENGNPHTLDHGLNSWECAPERGSREEKVKVESRT